MTDLLRPHERLDDLVLDGMKLIQRDDQFCFSIDTVLLAHFGPVLRGPALDLGTGTAAIPLILTARGATDVTGVELNPVMADIARRNAALNGRDDRIRIVEGDYRRIKEWSPSGYYSVVYANPPYREKSLQRDRRHPPGPPRRDGYLGRRDGSRQIRLEIPGAVPHGPHYGTADGHTGIHAPPRRRAQDAADDSRTAR